MNTILKNAFIKKFTKGFAPSKEINIIKYLTIIGIDYVNTHLNDSKDLEGDLRRISSNFHVLTIYYKRENFQKSKQLE